VKDLCLHTYGCRVIQRILEKCLDSQTDPIIDAIILDIQALTKDQFGNYVI
jgi:pumilio RNA-binding family